MERVANVTSMREVSGLSIQVDTGSVVEDMAEIDGIEIVQIEGKGELK